MRKLSTLLMLMAFMGIFAQKKAEDPQARTNITPNGIFDVALDRFGNKYRLEDLIVPGERSAKKASTSKIATTCNPGYFNLYFETGSGMEIVGNAAHDARRAVFCQVFQDLANFIPSTALNASGERVNILVANIVNIPSVPASAAGLATSFYMKPFNSAANFGGIADNEIWKTIHTGQDSYTNVVSPLYQNAANPGLANSLFYHGLVSFNFTSFSWNTNLSINCPSNQLDLYTVVLHEVVHALGFASLISSNGNSVFGTGYKYYSRYDRFLKNSANTQFLLAGTGGCGSMYNYQFNTALSTSVLSPNTGSCISGNTTCGTAIRYVSGSANVPVYTPNCYETGSSLSHFEDQCIGAPNANNLNNYFVMADGISNGITKRFLKPEERQVLCNIGYTVNTTFGSASTASGTFNYGGSVCSGISVAGTNDGINPNGSYTFTATSGVNLNFMGSAILGNDTNATSFECLQDVYGTSSVTATGTSATTITFSSTTAGIHLLRYVPVNGSQRGNITYVYVYVLSANCTPSACNIVNNGGFESSSSCGFIGTTNPPPTIDCWQNLAQSPDLFRRGCTSTTVTNVGTSTMYSTPASDSHNLSPNNAFVGIFRRQDYAEALQGRLSSPLIAGQQYRLSLWVKADNGYTTMPTVQMPIKVSSFASTVAPVNLVGTTFAAAVPGSVQLGSDTLVPNDNTWHYYTYTFTFPAGTPNHNSIGIYTTNTTGTGSQYQYTFIDDVSIVPLSQSATLDLPSSYECLGEWLPLADYLTGAPTDGVFSGTGITNDGFAYYFDPRSTGSGTFNIEYTFTNNLGCSVTIADTITVGDCCSCLATMDFQVGLPSHNSYPFTVTNSDPNCSGGGRVRWDFGDGSPIVTSYSNPIYHTFPSNGIYTVTMTVSNVGSYDQNLCTSDPVTYEIVIGGGLGRIADKKESTVSVYPNPTSSEINVEVEMPANGKVTVKVSDLAGKKIHAFTKKVKKGMETLNFKLPTGLEKGIFLVEIESDYFHETKKIVVN